jgi:hypothetical protein
MEAPLPKTISVEAESPEDSATLFRLRIDDLIVGEDLTAVQAHLLVGIILERVVLPRQNGHDRPTKIETVENQRTV